MLLEQLKQNQSNFSHYYDTNKVHPTMKYEVSLFEIS